MRIELGGTHIDPNGTFLSAGNFLKQICSAIREYEDRKYNDAYVLNNDKNKFSFI
jgi:hypothetical protein